MVLPWPDWMTSLEDVQLLLNCIFQFPLHGLILLYDTLLQPGRTVKIVFEMIVVNHGSANESYDPTRTVVLQLPLLRKEFDHLPKAPLLVAHARPRVVD